MDDLVKRISQAIEEYEIVFVCADDCKQAKRIEQRITDEKKCMVMRLNCDEITEFKRLYNTYEFSDRVTLIDDSVQYGSMLNYLRTGVLTEDEYYAALVHKRS